MKPSYIQITPNLGELLWNLPPSDELLALQLAYMDFLQSYWADELHSFRMGFTRISLQWKSPISQEKFNRIVPSHQMSPKPLSKKVWEIPVCYAAELGEDLNELAKEKQMSVEELIALHTSPTYRIHFFGFLPGFFYLNGLHPLLHAPRKPIPRLSVPSGTVAIGGSQTGIYPRESPGGWHLIGQSPVVLFDPLRSSPLWAKSGDQVKFMPIDLAKFQSWSHDIPTFYLS